jgi:MtN3 and saliva related transmembrane protein
MLSFIVSIVAPILTSIQLLPQLYKTYRSKSVKDISFYSLLLFLISSIVWIIHGYFIFDISLIVAGILAIFVNISLLILYVFYKK